MFDKVCSAVMKIKQIKMPDEAQFLYRTEQAVNWHHTPSMRCVCL